MTVKRYQEMSRDELEQAAREKGLSGFSQRSKEELIEMLESGSGGRQQRQESGSGRQQGQARQSSAPGQGGNPKQKGSKPQG